MLWLANGDGGEASGRKLMHGACALAREHEGEGTRPEACGETAREGTEVGE